VKKWVVGIASGMVVAGSIVPTAMAATASTKAQSSSIVVNNESVAAPATLQQGGSTYVPVWYVMKALKAIGLQSEWTGGNWFLSTTSMFAKPASAGKTVPGQVTVYLNASKLVTVHTVVAKDPASKHDTTYVQVGDLTAILQKANVFANWSNGSYQMQTPTVKTLDTAFQNTQSAAQSQMTGNLTELLHFTMNPQSPSTTSTVPQDITIQMKMTAETGTVNGQKAALVTITPQTTAAAGSALPKSIQEYIQGTRVWLNQGQGWTEQTSSEQLIQAMQSQMPLNNVNFSVLRNIQSSSTGNSTNYTATLDANALAQVLAPMMNSIASTSTQGSAISSTQIASLLNDILKQTTGSLQITVQPVNGQDRITGEQLALDMTLPMSTLIASLGSAAGSASSSSLSSAKQIQSISIHETMSATYAYSNTPITVPTGINTSTTAVK
jgi:hypothetical protein